MILCTKFGWNLMKTVEGVVFRKSWNRKFCKVHRMTPTKLKESGIKTALNMCTVVPRVPNFRPFRSTSGRSWDISHFKFPFDSYVKIPKCHKIFKTWPIAKKSNIRYSTMVAQCPHNVWVIWDENCERNSVLKFPAPYGPVLTKNVPTKKCHNFFGKLPK